MKEDKPPRRKVSTRRNGPEDVSGKVPGRKEAPAAAERTDDEPAVEGKSPSAAGPEPREVRSQPVTNHDEQDKITNASESDLPIAE